MRVRDCQYKAIRLLLIITTGVTVMKRFILIIGMLFTLLGFSSPAYSWGSAIHAYIGKRLDEQGILKANVVYGQMAADTFNFMFDAPLDQMQYLYAVTHGFTDYELFTVLPVLDLAETKREKALAFGFVTHNNVNGVDVSAHGYPYNNPEGYVIGKALELNEILEPLLLQMGLAIPDDVLLEVSHTFVEYAADLLIRKYDRAIGASMVSAAMTRDDGFPGLLTIAYAEGLAETFDLTLDEATAIIHAEEAKFRRLMINYGAVLQYGDRKAQAESAKFLAELAPSFFAAYGIEIPSEALLPVIEFGIGQALELCKDDLLPTVEHTIEDIKAIDWYSL